MQEMNVDVDVFEYLPAVVRANMIYHSRVYTDATIFSDFVLTAGQNPVLYEVNGKQILSTLQLTKTIFKDVVLPKSSLPPVNDDDLAISINVYFSYKKKDKEPFYLFQINSYLLILGKIDQQLTVYREFKDITEYQISDEHCTGEPNIEIIFMNEMCETFELASLSYASKGIDLRSLNSCCEDFEKLTQNLQDKVAKMGAELDEVSASVQKQMHEFQTNCQTIDESPYENIHILSRYGDYWLRNINNHILIGIPVYNCSTCKNLVEKIRISISPPSNRLKFTYSHKLYTFQTENAAIEPLKFQEICEPIVDAASQYNLDDKQDANTQNELAFGQEWTNHKQFLLYPDNAAVIIIKMALSDFEMEPMGCEFNVFAMYSVFTGDGLWKEFQTHLATVKIDPDIFHDKRYSATFESDKLYQDLLAVIASTDRRCFRVKLDEDIEIQQISNFLMDRLSFESIVTSLSIEDNYRYFLSQNLDFATTMNHANEDHQMYYCPSNQNYWSGTLVRMRILNDSDDNDNSEPGEIHEMKIYNRDPIKISNLIAALMNEMGRKISVKPLGCFNRTALELELKSQFREEYNALDELARQLKYKTNKVQKAFDEFINAQHKTDSIWAELVNDQ